VVREHRWLIPSPEAKPTLDGRVRGPGRLAEWAASVLR
jgi:hypothetical protein